MLLSRLRSFCRAIALVSVSISRHRPIVACLKRAHGWPLVSAKPRYIRRLVNKLSKENQAGTANDINPSAYTRNVSRVLWAPGSMAGVEVLYPKRAPIAVSHWLDFEHESSS